MAETIPGGDQAGTQDALEFVLEVIDSDATEEELVLSPDRLIHPEALAEARDFLRAHRALALEALHRVPRGEAHQHEQEGERENEGDDGLDGSARQPEPHVSTRPSAGSRPDPPTSARG